MNRDLFQRIWSQSAWYWLGNTSSRFLGLGVLILAGRLLGPGQFGIFSALAGVSLFLTAIADFGLSSWATRRMASDSDSVSETLSTITCIAAGTSLAVLSFSVFTVWLLEPNLLVAMATLQTAACAALLANLLSGVLIAHGQARIASLLSMSEKLSMVSLLALAVLTIGLTIEILALCYLLGASVRLISTFMVVGKSRNWTPQLVKTEAVRSALKQSWPFGLTQALYGFGGRLDVVALALFSASMAGMYAASFRFVEASFLIVQSLSLSLLPLAVQSWKKDPHQFRKVSLAAIGTAVGLSVPIALTLFLGRNILVSTVYGDRFTEAPLMLSLLAIVIPFAFFNSTCASLLNSVGKEKQVAKIAAVNQVLRLGGMVILPRVIGAEGPAVAVLAGTVVAFIAYAPAIRGVLETAARNSSPSPVLSDLTASSSGQT